MTNPTLPPKAYQDTQHFLRRKVPPSLYYKARTFSRQHPLLFLPLARRRWQQWREKHCPDITGIEPAAPQPLTHDTEIVIEGFPRTANTFAYIAFKSAQNRPVKAGHHTHAAAQVIAGVKKNLPTVVLIRDPEAAVISYLIGGFDPEISMKQVIYDYIAFYKPILPYRDRYILASFEAITQDYGAVIRRVNEKFGTQFQEFDHTEENVKECFDLIDQGYQKFFGQLKESVACRPSESRKVYKESLKQQFYSENLVKLRTQAYDLFNRLQLNRLKQN
ncbi:MAG: hypothetical protein GVY17_07165 [Cyanobacteria bacterium]|jgi:hypothetical protein|nr:hypothetical protein [Cyanobacteria bacterium GSL.Bin21]